MLSMFILGIIVILFLNLGSSLCGGKYIVRLTYLIFMLSLGVSLNGFIYDHGSLWGSSIGILSGLYQVTPLSQLSDSFIFLLGGLVVLQGSWIRAEGGWTNDRVVGIYGLIVGFSTLGMSLLISANDLMSFILSLELQSLPLYILASINRESQSATSSGLKYFLLGGLSSGIILFGCSVLYGWTGLTQIDELAALSPFSGDEWLGELSLVMIGVGLLFKIAAAPFHNWAPDLYDAQPTWLTSWLSVLPKISVITFMTGLVSSGIKLDLWCDLLLTVGVISLIVGSIQALTQYRVKRLLAFSSISHVGFMVIALGINTEQSITSLIFYLIQYSITTLNLFLILIPLSPSVTSPYTLSQLKAQYLVNPLLGISLAITLFSMVGLPPLIGFFGKVEWILGGTEAGYWWVVGIAIITSVISGGYYFKVIGLIQFLTDPQIQRSITVGADGEPNNSTVGTSLKEGGNFKRDGLITPNSSRTVELTHNHHSTEVSNPIHPYLIASITLILMTFFLYPTPLLYGSHLVTLTMLL